MESSSLQQVLHHARNADGIGSNTIKDLYDHWTGSYDTDLLKQNYQGPTKVSAVLSEHCTDKSASILDCGCGTGLIGEKLHALGYSNITGLDISQKSLDVAEQKGVYNNLVCTEVGKEKMPFGEDEFDAIICSGCILPTHMRPSCFREWVRVVKPGGIIALAMRQCYIEVVKGEEEYFSKDFQLEFDEVTQDLERSKSWQIISKTNFPQYYEGSLGLVVVSKVLQK